MKILFLDLYLTAQKEAAIQPIPLSMFLSGLQLAVPYVYRFYKGQFMFANDWQQNTELGMLMIKFILNMVNLQLMFQLNSHLSVRHHMKRKLLTMIDPRQSEAF